MNLFKTAQTSQQLVKTYATILKKKEELAAQFAETTTKTTMLQKEAILSDADNAKPSGEIKNLQNNLFDLEQKSRAADLILRDIRNELQEVLLSEARDRLEKIEAEQNLLQQFRETIQTEFLKSFAKCLHCETLLYGPRYNERSLKFRNEYAPQKHSEVIHQELEKLADKGRLPNVHQKSNSLARESERLNKLLTDEAALDREVTSLLSRNIPE